MEAAKSFTLMPSREIGSSWPSEAARKLASTHDSQYRLGSRGTRGVIELDRSLCLRVGPIFEERLIL